MDILALRNAFRRLNSETGGQVFVLFLAIAVVMVMMIGIVYNVGNAVGEKMKLQNMCDAAAYSEAVWVARSYNYFAYTNRAMVAHFCTISFCVAIDSAEQLWADIADTAGNIPYIGPVLKAIHEFYQVADEILNGDDHTVPKIIKEVYNPFYQQTQQFLFRSMMVSLLASDIADDIVRTTEDLNGEPHNIEVNPDLLMGLGEINRENYVGIVDHDGTEFKTDFNKLKSVINSSLDSFATGSPYFPRHLLIYIPPEWLGPLPGTQKIGFEASHDIKTDEFWQQDRFVWKTWCSISIWPIDLGFGWQGPSWSRTATFDYDLDEFKYPHLKSPDDGSSADRRSIWIVLKKPKADILQFPVMLDMREPDDLYAITRAEVYYKNPENEGEPPTLFNAYWHAKLGPVIDDTLHYSNLESVAKTALNGWYLGKLYH